MTFKDFLGNELSLGDEVVFVQQNYRNYLRGHIVAFTPKNVRVSFIGDSRYPSSINEILQQDSQLIKVMKND